MDRGCLENEVRTDVTLLLDCLKCQVNNPAAVNQALLTLSSIFSACDFVKEYFKDIGGLTFLVDLLTSMENPEVQERTFFCLGCAIERNVFCQKSLTSSTVFKFIQTVLSKGSTARLKQTATFLLINLVSNNGEGQVLMKQTQCLSTLIELLCQSLPRNMRGEVDTGFEWFDNSGPTSIELWTSVINALCSSINNPQNDENQKVCGLQIPFIFKLLKQQSGISSLRRPLLFLLGFIVSNNRSNQDQVRRCGGLNILCLELVQLFEQLNDPEVLKEAVQVITTIDSCISDNADSANELEGTEIIQILALVACNEQLDIGDRIKVTITLGHAIESSASNRILFLEGTNGLQELVHILTTSKDEELIKAIKYVLQLSVQKDPQEEEWHQDLENEKVIGENILQKMNELANRLNAIEKEKELVPKVQSATMAHIPNLCEQFTKCQDLNLVHRQEPDGFHKKTMYPLPNSTTCPKVNLDSSHGSKGFLEGNSNSCGFQVQNIQKQQLCMTPLEKHLFSELLKERSKNVNQDVTNHIPHTNNEQPCSPDTQNLEYDQKTQAYKTYRDVMMPNVSGACNYRNVTNHEAGSRLSPAKVPDTRSLSSNSTTKSFDVDLTEMVHREEATTKSFDVDLTEMVHREEATTKSFDVDLTEMVHREEAKCNSHENFAVPTGTYLPLKKQLRSRRYVPSEDPYIPDTGNMTDRESEVQSEFDCKLLSGALYHKDMMVQSVPAASVGRLSVVPLEKSNQELFKTPEYPILRRYPNTSCTSRTNCIVDPKLSVKSFKSTLSALQHHKISANDCRRRILDSENSISKMNCVGCSGTSESDDTQLNSRTINIVIESNPFSCQLHREVRDIERSYIQKIKQQRREGPVYNKQHHTTPNEVPVYEFSSESEPEVSPPNTVENRSTILRTSKVGKKRRSRIPYSEEEIDNLVEGVHNIGKFWGQILATYEFHPSRTAVDLMEKYKRLHYNKRQRTKCVHQTRMGLRNVPFSMCEERRLLKGVQQFGYSWKTILNSYKFSSVRTAEDLRNKWRSMNS